MRILVTGGGGFVGGALIRQIPLCNKVISLDHGRTYPYLSRIIKNNVILKKGDVGNSQDLDKSIKGVDIIVHLGAIAGERLCLANPTQALISNVYATHKLLEYSWKYKIKKLIFASSYWVYPTFKKMPMPLDEKDSSETTDSFYGMLKLCGEDLFRAYKNSSVILRLSTIYGFGSGFGCQWRGIVGKYILSVFRDKPLIVYGDGSQKIDLVHIDDIVSVLIQFIEQRLPKNLIFNIGSGQPVSVSRIAHIVRNLAEKNFGIKSKIKKVKAPPGKIWPDKWLCINRIKRYIKNYPSIDLENGIFEMMQKLYELKKNDNTIYKTILQSGRY